MQNKGRPKKYRIVRMDPKINQFSPRGKPGRPNEHNLSMEEFEALRLVDYMGFCQKEAAKSMHISQPTFSRILKRARKVIANCLINGAIIKIQGGHYVISTRQEIPAKELPQTAQGR
ncbi:MAG: DUF134 domain-containing protein [Candidatus Omnitrophica bacterium]|nr:DUF134 domain-containing protein [Candidatus Omnitrophota bacterium]MDD5238687.1 DUF134 domain-containing protein [Candidatus Omnitrophota bacterium]